MKVTALYILHYGKAYLGYSMQSIYNQVDEILLFYTEHPSHGTPAKLPNPDSKEELQAAVYDPDGKATWIDANFHHEGNQRDYAEKVCKERGADIILVCDYDEIWIEESLKNCIRHIQTQQGKTNDYRVRMKHLWRSFNYICKDTMTQRRLINCHSGGGIGMKFAQWAHVDVYHFGYAISKELMKYKLSIHGHQSEWRTGWYGGKFNIWPPPSDVHPTCLNTWYPTPFDKNDLPEIMRSHPYFNQIKIE